MHHYGEDSTSVVPTGSGYRMEFTNKVTGAVITMDVPAWGALEDSESELQLADAQRLAGDIAHLLRTALAYGKPMSS